MGVDLERGLERGQGRASMAQISLPLVDLVVWIALIAAGTLAIRRWLAARRAKTAAPVEAPCPRFHLRPELVGFVAIAGLSVAYGAHPAAGWRELVQLCDTYLLLFGFVVLATLPKAIRDHLPGLVSLALVLWGLVALWQISRGTPIYLLRSVFRDHQSMVAAVVLLAPVAWAGTAVERHWATRIASWAAVSVACAGLGSLGAMLLVVLCLLLASLVSRRGRMTRVLLAVAGPLCVLALLMPRSYNRELTQQPASWLSVPVADRHAQVLRANDALHPPPPWLHFGALGAHVFLSADFTRGLEPQARDKPKKIDPQTPPRRVIPEYFAQSWSALRIVGEGPFLGHGLGNWQSRIGTRYGTLERTGTSFSNQINGYLLLAVTAGIPGMLAWILALVLFVGRGLEILRRDTGEAHKGVVAGAILGLIGGAIFMGVYPLATQPMAALWIVLAGLIDGFHRTQVVSP